MGLDHRSPSAGRFARWALVLVLPLVLSAAAIPWALDHLRSRRQVVGPVLARAGLDGPDGAAAPAAAPEPPRHPEAPSTAEIEAAREAELSAGRLQQRNLAGAATFSPRPAIATADGERVAPFQGFGLSIDSVPAAARALVGGRDVGETPIVTTVDCQPGREVEVSVEKAGYRPARRAVRCRSDALLELSFRLVR